MTSTKERVQTWQPPPASKFKLNFDAAIFADLGCSGVGVIIRNEKGEVMGTMTAKGPGVTDSMEVEALACRRALEFAVDIGITELVIEGDCAQVISTITSNQFSLSQLGHVFEDIQVLISSLRWAEVHWVNRSANLVAHSLARNAKDAVDDVIWLEDSLLPALEALYHNSLSIIE